MNYMIRRFINNEPIDEASFFSRQFHSNAADMIISRVMRRLRANEAESGREQAGGGTGSPVRL